MSIWTDIATQLGGQLVQGLGQAAANRIQEALRGEQPYSAFTTGSGFGGFTDLPPLSSDMTVIPGMDLGVGTGPRKRRRMNPTNVHALRRSLRRVEGFVRLEKRVDKIVNRVARSSGRARKSGFVRDGGSRRSGQPGTQVINVE